MKSGLIRIVSLSASLSAAAVVGDRYDICDNIINPIRYGNVPVADGFYPQPFDLRKQYRFNRKGALEVYFGNVEMYPVKEGLRVNEREFGELLKERMKVWVREGSKKLDEAFYIMKKWGYVFFGENEK